MEKNSKTILAQNLSQLMLDHGLNQVELAKKTARYGKGVNQKTISNYLDRSSESVANPCLKKIDSIAKCFDLTTSQILSEGLLQPKDVVASVEFEQLKASMVEGTALLFEAGILDNKQSQFIIESASDIAKATAIMYNGNEDNQNQVVFDFVSYLSARKASGLD